MPGRRLWLLAVLALTGCAGATGASTEPPSPARTNPPTAPSPAPSPTFDLSPPDATPAAAGVPWGLARAPRMPFDAPRIAELFAALPPHVGHLTRSPIDSARPLVVSYDDADGQSAVLLYAIPFRLLETAPALVDRAATELRVISAAEHGDLAATSRLIYLAGGVAGADPPLHAFIWAYSDRGHGFVLLTASPEMRRLIVEALIATLEATDPARLYSAGPRESRATCTTNVAGDNLKC